MNRYVNIYLFLNKRYFIITDFQKALDVSFLLSYPEYLRKNFQYEKKDVCVCIVLVPFGPFPQRINGKSLKLDVWAVSVNFL